MEAAVTLEARENVAWIWIDAPRSNALTARFATDVADAVARAGADERFSAIALMTHARNFCTGADTDELAAAAQDPLADEHYDALGTIYELFVKMQSSPLPIIAGVNGKVLGAGINLALACDVRIASTDLDVRGFAVAGVHPGGGHLRMLERNLAPGWPEAVALFGQSIDASSAVASGFALRCVEPDALADTVGAIAAGAGGDGALTRKVTANYRGSQRLGIAPDAAVSLERASQVWSLRRRFAAGN